ncbi:hypothetical protein MMC2321_04224 [Chitinophaga sp. MM2321]
MLFVLIGLLCTTTAKSTYAQRGHGGGGGGGSRVHMSAPHFSAPRSVSRGFSSPHTPAVMNRGYYSHSYRPPVYHSGGYYRRPWYRPGYRHFYGYNPFFPPLGFYVSTLPYGYFTLGAAFGPMYYYGGTYYESDNDNGYKVVEPPMDAAVPDLPDGAQEIQVNGNTYYEVNGTYYQEIMTDNGRRFKVVGENGKIGNTVVAPQDNNDSNANAPAENIISALPDGCRTVNINGQQYYLSPDGMYYQEVKTNNTTGYKIVGKMNADN